MPSPLPPVAVVGRRPADRARRSRCSWSPRSASASAIWSTATPTTRRRARDRRRGRSTPRVSRAPAETGGFPEFATRNTTRVGGVDADRRRGLGRARHLSDPGRRRLDRRRDDRARRRLAGIARGRPARRRPDRHADPAQRRRRCRRRRPPRSPRSRRRASTTPTGPRHSSIGDVAVPGRPEDDYRSRQRTRPTSPTRSTASARRSPARRIPTHLLVVSSTDSSLAMPAAAWAARSGDPILFADGRRRSRRER